MQWIKTTICGECGVPAIWADWISVDSDNTAIDSKAKMRAVFYEDREVQNLFDKIEEAVAVPLGHVCFEAHKKAIRYLFEGATMGFMGNMIKKTVPRLVVDRVADAAPLFGVGTLTVKEFRRGESLTVESGNTFNEKLCSSDVGGGFEAICQIECNVEREDAGDKYIHIAKRRSSAIEEFEGRFEPIRSESIGTMDTPRCERCGAPFSFRVYKWNKKIGEIRERDTGLRVVFESHAAVDSLLLEIEKEIGSEILDMAMRIEADYVKERILSDAYEALLENKPAAETIDEYLSLIGRRCFGNPVESYYNEQELKVTIRNPVNEALVVGRVLGSYEAITGVNGEVSTRRDDEALKINVEPARDQG